MEHVSIGAPKLVFLVLLCASGACLAAGGPFGIDHRLSGNNPGIFNRGNQNILQYSVIGIEAADALWEGGETRVGKTFWQSVDSAVLAAGTTEVMKVAFGRQRPSQTDNPNQFFAGGRSFPSGEVANISSIVTPFVLEYRHDMPWVYGLELLPIYDAIARVKVRGHWQSDVLVGFGIGTLTGYYAHSREQPLILNVLPHGFTIGIHRSFNLL
ncbi:MAG: phosphatase PAP2 family protein [Burkholderiales bacterium]